MDFLLAAPTATSMMLNPSVERGISYGPHLPEDDILHGPNRSQDLGFVCHHRLSYISSLFFVELHHLLSGHQYP